MKPAPPAVSIGARIKNQKKLLILIDYLSINDDNTQPLCGAIAQLGERNTGSVEVSGSIPLSSTTFLRGFVKDKAM